MDTSVVSHETKKLLEATIWLQILRIFPQGTPPDFQSRSKKIPAALAGVKKEITVNHAQNFVHNTAYQDFAPARGRRSPHTTPL